MFDGSFNLATREDHVDFLDQLVQILSGIWKLLSWLLSDQIALAGQIANVLMWVLQCEEQLALQMNKWAVPFGHQVTILVAVNSFVLIPGEYGIVHTFWLTSNRVRNFGTPRWLRWIARDKPITPWDLTIFGLVPLGTQKLGVIAWHAKRKEFGWRGYAHIAVGGALRVSLYPLLGKWIWAIVVCLIILRVVDLWNDHQNGRSKNRSTF